MPFATDGKGNVNVNIRCVHCRYNLRGLSAESKCPECGREIAIAIDPRRLVFAPSRWIRRVRNGLAVILWSWIVGATALFLIPFAVRIFIILEPAVRLWPQFVVIWVAPLGTLIGALAAASRRPGYDTGSRAAREARQFGTVASALSAISIVLFLAPLPWPLLQIRSLILALNLLLSIATLAACLRHVAGAVRSQDPSLADAASRCAAFLTGLIVLAGTDVALHFGKRGGVVHSLAVLLAGLLIAGGFVLAIYTVALLARLSRLLGALANEAAEREAG